MPSCSVTIRQALPNHRKGLANRVAEAEALLQQPAPTDEPGLRQLISQLSSTKQKLCSAIEKLENVDREWCKLINSIKKDDVQEEELALYEAVSAMDKNGYFAEIYTASGLSDDLSIHISEAQTALSAIAQDAQNQPLHQVAVSTPQQTVAIKLPKLELPKFDGDVLKWNQFWSVFDSSVNQRTDLPDATKFSYLMPQLKGAAKDAIDGLSLTNANYRVAVGILQRRFDQSRDRLVAMLFGQFKRIPRCGGRREDKRRTFDASERVLRQLQEIGEDVESKALTFDLLSKFPQGFVKDLQRYYHVAVHSPLSDVRTAIGKFLDEQESTAGMLDDLDLNGSKSGDSQQEVVKDRSYSNRFHNNSYQKPQSGNKFEYRNSTLAAVGGFREFDPPTKCYFCSGQHFNGSCSDYPTAKSRLARLRELKRCVRCGRSHSSYSKRCEQPIKCYYCKTANHHWSPLCFKRFPDHARSSVLSSQGTPGGPSSSRYAATLQSVSNDATASNQSSVRSPIPFDQKSGQKHKCSTDGLAILASGKAKRQSLFQTAKVAAVNLESAETCSVRIALDTLSSSSYILTSKAKQLRLKSLGTDKQYIKVFGACKASEFSTHDVQFGLVKADGNVVTIDACAIDDICDTNVLPSSWPEAERSFLNSLKLSRSLADDFDDENKTIDVLIGTDYVWDFVTGPRIQTDTRVSLIPTVFGLMIAGSLLSNTPDERVMPTMLCITPSPCQYPSQLGYVASESKFPSPIPDIDEYWKLETVGISDDIASDEDKQVLQSFENTVYFDDGRYHVSWPWIDDKKALLPTNYDVAITRLRPLTNRLRSDPKLLESYREVVCQQKLAGIIEVVPENEIQTTNTVHYLPHHPVVKASSATTKVRIVYDASAKRDRHNVSLNECLLRGPVILPDLCQLLLRFRAHRTIVISDIEKAFLQVALQPSDRDATRFLWYKDDQNPSTAAENVAVYRFCRVAFGMKSSPFLLGATIQHHLSQQKTPFADRLKDDIYVDNVISGVDDSSIEQYYHEVKTLFSKAGMNLQEFCSNSAAINCVPPEDRMKDPLTKVLGMRWDSQSTDTIGIMHPTKWPPTAKSSKRAVLQAIASIFDPLGFFQPALFPAKIFLQKLWTHGHSWDAPLNKELRLEWETIYEALQPLFDFDLPRYGGSVNSDSMLLVFSDASFKGYGACVYLRSIDEQGNSKCNLIFAKSRLAPTVKNSTSTKAKKQTSIPRLELLGATIAAKAAQFCRQAFLKLCPEMPVHFFIDSECVLHWLRSLQQLKQFVQRRLDVIRSVDNATFHYVATDENPADLLTKGKSTHDLKSERLWWSGPKWVCKSPSEWPQRNLPPVATDALKEVSRASQPSIICHAAPSELQTPGPMGIDPSNFSTMNKLLRTTCVVLKFLRKRIWDKLAAATQQRLQRSCVALASIPGQSAITTDDYQAALQLWIRHVQRASFQDVLTAIETNRKNSLVLQLGLQVDASGILRCHGRYANAELADPVRFPILLPKGNQFSRLAVVNAHQLSGHCGVSQTLTELRQRYWVPQGRAFVRKVLNTCRLCRKAKTAVPFALPDMPPWPVQRVRESAPFQYTGVDYFGPLKVRVGESTSKMWCSLFTCLATRAVHLEVVTDCTPAEFMRCFLRFISRRGCPSQVISDNAAQFQLTKILADRAWKRTPADASLLAYSAQHGVQWRFIVELAPWQGGHYERLVGVVKSVLKTAIGRRILTWTDLVTLCTETEAIVNSRPITHVDSDLDSHFRVLRPIDFLLSRPASVLANDDFPIRDLGDSSKRLMSIWKQREKHLIQLWKNWHEQYLLSLRETSKASHRNRRGSVVRAPVEGEVVLVRDDDIPRGCWKLAIVTKVVPGSDGRVRAAEIRLPNGVELRRAVNFLYPLEVCSSVADSPSPSADSQVVPSGADNDVFQGFSPADVQRTVRALRAFDSPSDTEDVDDNE